MSNDGQPESDTRDTQGRASPGRATAGSFATPSPPAATAESFSASHVLDLVRVLYKRRRTALTAFVVVFVAGLLYTLSLTPMYEARVQLLIEVDQPNVLTFREVIDQNRATIDYFQTQYRILQSRTLARRTIEALKLWNDPQFSSAPHDGSGLMRGMRNVKTAVTNWVHAILEPQPVPGVPGLESAAQAHAIDVLRANMTVTPVRSSRLVDLTYRSTDAAFAARIVNGLARTYIQQNLEFKFTASKDASDWLGGQLAEQRKRVEKDEQALQQYLEQNDAVSLSDRQNIVVQKLVDLNAAVTRAKMDRIQKEALYNQVRATQGSNSSLDTLPAILSNSFIQQQKSALAELQRQQAQMSERLGPKHPDRLKINTAIEIAQAKLQSETAKIVQSLKNDYLAAQAQENSLTSALEEQKREALDLSRKGIDYGVLQRDATANRQLFESLLQRTREAGISGELRTSNIRVVDEAEVPRKPAYPNTSTNLAAFAGIGLLFGLGLAFFFEYLDNRIKSPDEMQQYLSIPYLGLIPAVARNGHSEPFFGNGDSRLFAESVRSLRTNVVFSFAEDQARSLLVTSAGPSEGKTLVAANVASALASGSQRVLLVDTDMRRPRLHELLGVKGEPGLSNLLVGTAKASDVIRKTTTANLWVLPAGTLPPNPAELLGSERFRQFLQTLKKHFDWIVFDSPPVLPVTDATVLGHLIGGVLFVVGAEMTSWQAVQNALGQLRSAQARFVGSVLNRVPLERHSYYYAHYYQPKYSAYYGQDGGAK